MEDREQSMNTMQSGKDRFLLDLESVHWTYWDAEVAMGALVLCRYGEDAFQFKRVERANRYAGRAPKASLLVHDHDVSRPLSHGAGSRHYLRTLSMALNSNPLISTPEFYYRF